MGADNQSLDALNWVHATLKAREVYIAGGRPLQFIKGIPGHPSERYVGVFVSSVHREGGHTVVDVALDLWTQETGIGAAAPMLEILPFLDRLCVSLARASSIGGAPHVGPITWASKWEIVEEKTFFYNVTVNVPVHVGGGI